jgi:two-component system, cell cycle sensor histidine kinase and response regulator CckA
MVLWLGLFGAVFCLAFSAQQRVVFGSSSAALTLAVSGVGFLFTPLLLRWTRSPTIVGHVTMAIFCAALGSLSYLRGGLVPTVMMWAAVIPPIIILLSVRYLDGIGWVLVILCEIAFLNHATEAGLPAQPPTPGSGSLGLSALVVASTAIAIGYDLGRRKQEEQQRELEQRLIQAEKLESVGRLAAGIAHDFNNLLTVIRTHTTLLAGSVNGENARQDLATIDKAVERGAELTSQLLAFGRRGILRQETFAIDALIREVKLLLERVLPQTIAVTVTLAPEVRSVTADRQQIVHVLLNLALNARDAMPAGGRLAIRARNCRVDDGAASPDRELHPGSYVSIDVADDGEGMSPELVTRIFEPFFTTRAAAGGSGLGLASAYGIVRRAGGTISVDSALGRGSTFSVYLPAAAELAAAPALEGAPPPAPPRATILLVEDEPAVRRATARLLARQGYVVLSAEDGMRALEVGESHTGPIHLLLTDVVMPRLSGHEVAKALAKQRPDMLIAYMSGYSDDPEVARQVAQHRAAFIRKPFEVDDLLRDVEAMLARGIGAGKS